MLIVIGILLVAAAATFGVAVVSQNQFTVKVDVFDRVWSATPAALFIAGVLVALVVMLALLLLERGVVRTRRKRREMKAALGDRDRLLAEREEQRRLLEARATATPRATTPLGDQTVPASSLRTPPPPPPSETGRPVDVRDPAGIQEHQDERHGLFRHRASR